MPKRKRSNPANLPDYRLSNDELKRFQLALMQEFSNRLRSGNTTSHEDRVISFDAVTNKFSQYHPNTLQGALEVTPCFTLLRNERNQLVAVLNRYDREAIQASRKRRRSRTEKTGQPKAATQASAHPLPVTESRKKPRVKRDAAAENVVWDCGYCGRENTSQLSALQAQKLTGSPFIFDPSVWEGLLKRSYGKEGCRAWTSVGFFGDGQNHPSTIPLPPFDSGLSSRFDGSNGPSCTPSPVEEAFDEGPGKHLRWKSKTLQELDPEELFGGRLSDLDFNPGSP